MRCACGATVPWRSAFCPRCGARLANGRSPGGRLTTVAAAAVIAVAAGGVFRSRPAPPAGVGPATVASDVPFGDHAPPAFEFGSGSAWEERARAEVRRTPGLTPEQIAEVYRRHMARPDR